MKITKSITIILLALILINLNVLGSSIINSNNYHNRLTTQTPNIIAGPYTQNQQDNSIIVMWETNIKTTTNEVHWGLTADCENIESEKFSIKQNNIHTVKIKNLNPSTKYYYKIVTDDVQSIVYSFQTRFQHNDSIHFVAYGDGRGVWDNWYHAKKVAVAIESVQPDFVLHTGDFVNNGTIVWEWRDFFQTSSFVHNSTLYPVLGNHEYYAMPYFNYFSTPHNERWYSFDNGPVHFIVLDSNYANSFKIRQLVWLIFDLLSNDKPFTVVSCHHPLYSSGNHGSAEHLRKIWKPFFEHFNVDLVFNGHDHSYERGKVNNVNYVVTGGGGGPLYDVGRNWWTVYSESTYHFCSVLVNETTLKFSAIKPNGLVFDQFNLTKS